MVVSDLWRRRDGSPSRRDGRGLRWRVSVEGYPSSSHRTKTEADRVNAERLLAGPPRPESSVTVGELLDVWLAGKAHLQPRSRTACRNAAGHVRARWGRVLVGQVATPDVQSWLSSLEVADLRDGAEVGATRAASAASRSQVLQALSGVMGIAVQRGVVGANPCAGVRVGRVVSRDARFLSVEQLHKVVGQVPASQRAMVWLLATTGLRVGEAVALLVGDADVARRRLRVRTSKTGAARDVPVAAAVLAMLDLSRPASEPLLLGPAGGQVSIGSWRRWVWKPAVAGAGLEGLRIHDLRHTAASLAIASGADVKVVQRMLGHKSAAMTVDLYGHLWDKGLDDVATRVGSTLGLPNPAD